MPRKSAHQGNEYSLDEMAIMAGCTWTNHKSNILISSLHDTEKKKASFHESIPISHSTAQMCIYTCFHGIWPVNAHGW